MLLICFLFQFQHQKPELVGLVTSRRETAVFMETASLFSSQRQWNALWPYGWQIVRTQSTRTKSKQTLNLWLSLTSGGQLIFLCSIFGNAGTSRQHLQRFQVGRKARSLNFGWCWHTRSCRGITSNQIYVHQSWEIHFLIQILLFISWWHSCGCTLFQRMQLVAQPFAYFVWFQKPLLLSACDTSQISPRDILGSTPLHSHVKYTNRFGYERSCCCCWFKIWRIESRQSMWPQRVTGLNRAFMLQCVVVCCCLTVFQSCDEKWRENEFDSRFWTYCMHVKLACRYFIVSTFIKGCEPRFRGDVKRLSACFKQH